MFIDINAYIGHWPFRNLKYNTLAGLDKLASDNGITHMVVSNTNGFFYKDANTANLELLEELREYQGNTKFLPMAVVKPNYPAWEKDAREMIEKGFAGFELVPIYHKYTLEPEMLPEAYVPQQMALPVMELAKELKVPVRICASIENFRGRSNLDTYDNIPGDSIHALICRFPEVSVLATGLNPFGMGEKMKALAKERKNIFFDTTQAETFSVYTDGMELAAILDKEQLCFGSLSPFAYMEAAQIRCAFVPGFDYELIKKNGFRAFEK